jgi:hypothetical protein
MRTNEEHEENPYFNKLGWTLFYFNLVYNNSLL